MRIRYSIGIIAVIASMVNTNTLHAKETIFYKMGKLPDFSGIIIRDKDIFVPFEMLDISNTGEIMHKLLKIKIDGKKNCIRSEWRDDDTSSYVDSCASLKKLSPNRYLIKVVLSYDMSAWLENFPEDLQILKKDNHVKERTYEIDFVTFGDKCSATMLKRTYIPLDGTKRIGSTIGDLGCVVKRK